MILLFRKERERNKTLRVHEKTTASSRAAHCPMTLKYDDGKQDQPPPKQQASQGVTVQTRHVKENINEFIAKKREMFLVQMSLDVKKAEILKLDEKARMKEAALQKSQQMLDQDVQRFDTFLQANDARAHKAMKAAEDMTKRKQEKMQRIKQLKASISAIQSEISKHKEQKEECEKYKRFLTDLTSQEWVERQKEIAAQKKIDDKHAWVSQKHADEMALADQEIAIEREKFEDMEMERSKPKNSKMTKSKEEEFAAYRRQEFEKEMDKIRAKYRTYDDFAKMYVEPNEPEEEVLYFQDVSQLLDVYTQLEEQNLFLIQNLQETEQSLEEIQAKFKQSKVFFLKILRMQNISKTKQFS